jgi:hypothetical protein
MLKRSSAPVESLTELVYELLDAHQDTARLASELECGDEAWAAHLDYLRDLQRVGREALAGLGEDDVRKASHSDAF